ncbi:MAG TPA: AbrB/MazE/SpoVT family DNA-binding domain-containing protein [Candidatus Nanoarchaeia archaeon]|nr:AbrB/MazE/SpoVT family DNA-binding domain-containing protein [Candidatus Nanoarchaeia archaeon]
MDSKFIGKSKLTKSGQVTLPKEARQDLKIDQNSEIYWYEINDVLVLAKDIVNPSDIFDLINSKKKKRNK